LLLPFYPTFGSKLFVLQEQSARAMARLALNVKLWLAANAVRLSQFLFYFSRHIRWNFVIMVEEHRIVCAALRERA
jgi:hypothetical protein